MGQTTLRKLTPQRKLFVKNLLKGHNQKESAILAGYSKHTASTQSYQLLHNPSIIHVLERQGLTEERIAKELDYHITQGKGIKETADTSIRALELTMKARNILTTTDTNTNNNQYNTYIHNISTMTNEDIEQELNSINNKLIELKNK